MNLTSFAIQGHGQGHVQGHEFIQALQLFEISSCTGTFGSPCRVVSGIKEKPKSYLPGTLGYPRKNRAFLFEHIFIRVHT